MRSSINPMPQLRPAHAPPKEHASGTRVVSMLPCPPDACFVLGGRVHVAVQPVLKPLVDVMRAETGWRTPATATRSWLRGTRRWPPRLCTALEARSGPCFATSGLQQVLHAAIVASASARCLSERARVWL